MRHSEMPTSDEMAEFFIDCLKDHGIESVDVSHEVNHQHQTGEFYIRKQLDETDQLVYKTAIDLTAIGNPAEIYKRIVTESNRIAEKFREQLITTFEWDNRRIEVSPYDGGWARCPHCETRANAPKTEYIVAESCEFSDPTPVQRDMTREYDNMSDYEQLLFKLYLIGRLRDTCDPDCPNSRYSDFDKSAAYRTERFK